MITVPGSPFRMCDNLSRRQFLQVGSLGTAGLALPEPRCNMQPAIPSRGTLYGTNASSDRGMSA